jgi:hypothetical protein
MGDRGLRQPPFETTLMGVAAAAAERHGLPASVPALYGSSGHAFIINVHTALCPSGPYCWRDDGFEELLGNLGLRRSCLGLFDSGSSGPQRAGVEGRVRDLMDRGVPCSLLNMEHQLITGYDDEGFDTAQPWPGMDFPPARLTFGSWRELGDEVHAAFYAWERTDPARFDRALGDSLDFALALFDEPTRWALDYYAMGMDAWQAWIDAVEAGHGGSHGAWWNARVWGECRLMAGRYVAEAALRLHGPHTELTELAGEYTRLGTGMHLAAGRKMDPSDKKVLLRELRGMESRCVGGLRRLREALR